MVDVPVIEARADTDCESVSEGDAVSVTDAVKDSDSVEEDDSVTLCEEVIEGVSEWVGVLDEEARYDSVTVGVKDTLLVVEMLLVLERESEDVWDVLLVCEMVKLMVRVMDVE